MTRALFGTTGDFFSRNQWAALLCVALCSALALMAIGGAV